MNYVLLAATALGGVALYLMLPREKASLAKLGMLLAVLAFGGLFLFMFRMLATSPQGVSTVDPYFYLFAGIMVAGSIGVVCQPKPVYAALYFVLVTLAGSGLFVMLLAEFMAIVLIIIYAGAILVTYVFVIMLASQSSSGTGGEATSPIYDREAAEPFAAVLISFVLLGTILQCIYPDFDSKRSLITNPKVAAATQPAEFYAGKPMNSESRMVQRIELAIAADQGMATTKPASTKPEDQPMGDTQLLGSSLYGKYAISLELAGILLTIALIGAVVIARKEAPSAVLGTGQVPNE